MAPPDQYPAGGIGSALFHVKQTLPWLRKQCQFLNRVSSLWQQPAGRFGGKTGGQVEKPVQRRDGASADRRGGPGPQRLEPRFVHLDMPTIERARDRTQKFAEPLARFDDRHRPIAQSSDRYEEHTSETQSLIHIS